MAIHSRHRGTFYLFVMGSVYVILGGLMYQKILSRNIIWWAILALILSSSVNWRLCTIERGKYLLGILSNGYYQNISDGIVYKDYLKTHGITHEFIKDNI